MNSFPTSVCAANVHQFQNQLVIILQIKSDHPLVDKMTTRSNLWIIYAAQNCKVYTERLRDRSARRSRRQITDASTVAATMALHVYTLHDWANEYKWAPVTAQYFAEGVITLLMTSHCLPVYTAKKMATCNKEDNVKLVEIIKAYSVLWKANHPQHGRCGPRECVMKKNCERIRQHK